MLPIKILSLYKPGKLGQWIAITVVSTCAMSAALGFAWPLGALPKLRRGEAGFDLDLNEQSWVVSIMFFGYLISPVPSAYTIDHIGRRNSLCIFIWMLIASFVVMATTKGFWPLMAARVMIGFWVGLVYTVVPVYIGECAEPKVRGILGTFYGVFVYLGSLMISFMGKYLSYPMLSWIPALLSVILAILLCLVPESPYYYLSKGDVPSARASLTWLRGYCDETILESIQDSIKKSQKQQSNYSDIIRNPSTRNAFLMALLLGSVQRTSGLTILLNYISVTMPNYIVSAEEFTIVLNIVWIVSSFAAGLVMERFGRRVLMGVSCTGSSITMLGVAIWFFLRDKTDVDVTCATWLPFVLLMLHGVTYSIGIVSIPTMMPGEIFSPEIKAKASSLISICLSIVAGFVLNIFLPLESAVGVYINFLICSISSFIGVLSAIFIMMETRGKTLEEIQEELQGTKLKANVIETNKI